MVSLKAEDKKIIVEEIVNEVLKKLKKEVSPKEKVIVVFTGAPGLIEKAIDELLKLKERFQLVVAFSESARRMKQFSEVRSRLEVDLLNEERFYEEVNEAKVVIFPTLTQNTAAKIAWGIRDCLASEIAACALIMGKKVIAVCESLSTEGVSTDYAFLLEEIAKKLVKLGVILCKVEEVSLCLENGKSSVEISKSGLSEGVKKKEFIFEGRVLTSETVNGVVSMGCSKIIIDSCSLITPLAADIIRDKKIEVVRRMG
ncbi:MAG: hypothetical protein N3C62_03295 [Synergistetes bacterium]|nr:hypothetical protein [Synergistota bacterium]MCX8127756.1 hypothetical protein [Synergistota bacterium]MDW8191328.1 flavoprotein [Synergistota bacterium]